MIKKVVTLFIGLLYISYAFSGVVIVGNQFTIDSKSRSLNIKIINDDESDFLIKSELNDNRFLVTPPLFLLPKNSSDIITVLPIDLIEDDKDLIIPLTITAIPKSQFMENVNAVSLAIRTHFKVIYRHQELQKNDYNNVGIIRDGKDCYLSNNSDFFFKVSVSTNRAQIIEKIKSLAPRDKILIEKTESNITCNIIVSFYDEYNNIVNTLNLSN